MSKFSLGTFLGYSKIFRFLNFNDGLFFTLIQLFQVNIFYFFLADTRYYIIILDYYHLN